MSGSVWPFMSASGDAFMTVDSLPINDHDPHY